MKGIFCLTILEVAIVLLHAVGEPLQATAQIAQELPASDRLAGSSPLSGSLSRIASNEIQFTPPPGGGSPDISGTSGKRGHCGSEANKPGLRALVPESAWGQTISEYPTLWFDVPYSSDDDLPVEFVLQDRARNTLYRTKVMLPKMPGIIGIQVKETKSSLQPQHWYKWTLQVRCKGAKTNDKNDVVQGWIQRITPDPALMQQLKGADPRNQAMLYAKHGIWFDALTTLGDALNAKPQNADFLKDWETLLKSAGLQETTSRPIVKQ